MTATRSDHIPSLPRPKPVVQYHANSHRHSLGTPTRCVPRHGTLPRVSGDVQGSKPMHVDHIRSLPWWGLFSMTSKMCSSRRISAATMPPLRPVSAPNEVCCSCSFSLGLDGLCSDHAHPAPAEHIFDHDLCRPCSHGTYWSSLTSIECNHPSLPSSLLVAHLLM